MSSDDELWDPDEAELEATAAADMTIDEWRACTGSEPLTLDEVGALQDEYDL